MNKLQTTQHNAASETAAYYCPMHCEGDKTYDKPGDCPVCGMHLVKKGAEENAEIKDETNTHSQFPIK